MRRLLVANRGEIARRVFATCRSMGIETVAVYSDADADAPHVREADFAVRLPGSTPAETYLRGALLIEAALTTGADAVHPGYGFLSENAAFAESVVDAGLTWIGPPAKAVAAMGSKLEAKSLLADAGVPMLPSWTDPDQVTEFPVLVKASAGGGGRGMRVVRTAGELPEAIAVARREAAAAFGDGTVFCERYVETGRHVEVQVFGDTQGTIVALGERECSIQRRHQKIIEESPSPAVDATLRAALGEAAVSAGRAVGYVGAGTVEFLLAPDGQFYFLEMNTRLQVEHPVTECVTGLDLVRLQILVAEGQPLPFTQTPVLRGHSIEARLYAEDPARDWRPGTGRLDRFTVAGRDSAFAALTTPGVRLDSGVEDGSVVTVHYDPMLAKVIAWAPTRAEATRLLAAALARAEIHGPVTNRDLLTRVLRSEEFLDGGTDTAFLDRHPEVFGSLVDTDEERDLAGLAAALAGATARRRAAPWGALPGGWRNVPSTPQRVTYTDGPEITYTLRDGKLADWPDVVVDAASPDSVALTSGGVRRTFRIHTVDNVSYVDSATGSVALTQEPRFGLPVVERAAGSLIAPMPGTVGRVAVSAGQGVDAGDLLLTLEAMKLEHPVRAPHAGVVTSLRVEPGSQVEAGAVLAIVTPGTTPNNATPNDDAANVATPNDAIPSVAAPSVAAPSVAAPSDAAANVVTPNVVAPNAVATNAVAPNVVAANTVTPNKDET
jgi:propionyl-CoA carboxylase alpha chain